MSPLALISPFISVLNGMAAAPPVVLFALTSYIPGQGVLVPAVVNWACTKLLVLEAQFVLTCQSYDVFDARPDKFTEVEVVAVATVIQLVAEDALYSTA